MIYVIGDSFTYGYNFIFDKMNKYTPTRIEKIFSTHLGNFFNQKVINLSVMGGSNWRTARIISSLTLTKEDIVVINWSESSRLELGSNNKQILFNNGKKGTIPIIDTKKMNNLEENEYLTSLKGDFPFGEFIEKDENLFLRRMFPTMFTLNDKKILNDEFVDFAKIFYSFYTSDQWLEEMFKIMFMSSVYKLQQSNSKFVMFNTFTCPYNKDSSVFDIPNYFLGYKSNMCKHLRNNNNIDYWNQEEHLRIAELIKDQIS